MSSERHAQTKCIHAKDGVARGASLTKGGGRPPTSRRGVDTGGTVPGRNSCDGARTPTVPVVFREGARFKAFFQAPSVPCHASVLLPCGERHQHLVHVVSAALRARGQQQCSNTGFVGGQYAKMLSHGAASWKGNRVVAYSSSHALQSSRSRRRAAGGQRKATSVGLEYSGVGADVTVPSQSIVFVW